jgi:hypothetical protein
MDGACAARRSLQRPRTMDEARETKPTAPMSRVIARLAQLSRLGGRHLSCAELIRQTPASRGRLHRCNGCLD